MFNEVIHCLITLCLLHFWLDIYTCSKNQYGDYPFEYLNNKHYYTISLWYLFRFDRSLVIYGQYLDIYLDGIYLYGFEKKKQEE